MRFKYIAEVARWAIAIGAGIYLLRWVDSVVGSGGGLELRFDLAFEVVIALLFYALLLLGLFGRSFLNSVGNRFGNLFWADDLNTPVVPEYSTAEARAKTGRYRDAIEEYRKVIAEHPDDVYPHTRIADLLVTHLGDPKQAEEELLSGEKKAQGEDTVALVANRLADLYQHDLHDIARALQVLEQLVAKLPGTKAAAHAEQRIQTLRELAAGREPPKRPEKIAHRITDEETLRKRRGF